jgi:phosphoglycolate phosphatase
LTVLGLADLVETVLCGDDPGPIKPDPAALLAIAADLGAPIAAVAMIGDTAADLRMARDAGAGRVIGVASGVSGAADLEPIADVVLADVGELVKAPSG